MGKNTDRSYWLREFAGRAMQASYLFHMDGTRDVNMASTALAEEASGVAEALLSAIERKELETAHPNPPSDAENPRWIGNIPHEPFLRCSRCNYTILSDCHEAIRVHERTCWNPPSDGSVVASLSAEHGPKLPSADGGDPSPGTEDAQAGRLNTPHHTTDEALAQKGAHRG